MALLVILPLTVFTAYILWFPITFILNIFRSRGCGLPTIWVPTDPNHILWMLSTTPLRQTLQRWLPDIIYRRLVLTIYGWEFHERMRPYELFSGPRGNKKSYMLVTCRQLELWTWDSEIAHQILSRPRDFVQLDQANVLLNRFGNNVLTSDGDDWSRQRKVVASAINERISKAVFNESIRQTKGMLEEVGRKADGHGVAETNQFFNHAKKIAIHVLDNVGMGDNVPWDSDLIDRPQQGFKQTYIQTVKSLIHNVTGGILLPRWLLHHWPASLPGYHNFRTLGNAVDEFPVHTTRLLDSERQRRAENDSSITKGNILSQMLQASEGQEEKQAARMSKALSDSEMLGNLFVFTAAGFDTTANTVSYALVLLARYPEWQDWLLEEIDTIMPRDSEAEPDYVEIFPKAIRLQAIMYETLRLFPPLIHLSKQTKAPQVIATSTGRYMTPANTIMYVNTVCLHLDPDVWRNLNLADGEKPSDNDECRFRPSRWVAPAGSAPPFIQLPKGAYLPWSGGPRVCPGQKMAQVEFAAIFLTMLRRHRIDAVAAPGESREEVDAKLSKRMSDSISILTTQMKDVYDVAEGDENGLSLSISPRK